MNKGVPLQLSSSFIGIGSWAFSEISHGVRSLDGDWNEWDRFFEKKNCPKNEENGPKIGFFECVKKFGS